MSIFACECGGSQFDGEAFRWRAQEGLQVTMRCVTCALNVTMTFSVDVHPVGGVVVLHYLRSTFYVRQAGDAGSKRIRPTDDPVVCTCGHPIEDHIAKEGACCWNEVLVPKHSMRYCGCLKYKSKEAVRG